MPAGTPTALGSPRARALRRTPLPRRKKAHVGVDLQHSSNNRIDAALLGNIVLARFLENPLRAFDRFVARVESSAGFSALTPWVTVACLEGAQAVNGALDIRPYPAPALGEVREAGGRLRFLYHRESYAREYRFDEAELRRLKSCQDVPAELAGTLHRLRLINSRNRLTHALVQALLASQAEYLLSGEPLSLVALTQAQMSELLPLLTEALEGNDAQTCHDLTEKLSGIDGKIINACLAQALAWASNIGRENAGNQYPRNNLRAPGPFYAASKSCSRLAVRS